MAKNVKLTTDTIGDALDKLRGAVMIGYPMGLPPYDEVQQILDDCEQLKGRQAAKEIIPAGDMQVWWAGKELQRGKALHEYVGRNEKTKIVCKVQKVSACKRARAGSRPMPRTRSPACSPRRRSQAGLLRRL